MFKKLHASSTEPTPTESIMKRTLSALALALPLLAHQPSALANAAAYDRTLDAFSDMVVQYEKVAVKQPLCLSDVNALNINLLPALTRASNETQAVQASGYQPNAAQLQRYLEITGRMQKAMLEFSRRIKEAQRDC